MHYLQLTVGMCLALFLAMLLLYRAGYRLGRHRRRKFDDTGEATGAVTGAVFALLGLMIAFTFSGAFGRLDARRQIIVQEANAIGTAYLRLDLLPREAQAPLRAAFRDYTASRAALYPLLMDPPAARRELATTDRLQREIWSRAVAASQAPESHSARMLLLPALNDMIDITTTRSVAARTHTPWLVYFTLCMLALACAALAGYGASASDRLSLGHMTGFAAITAFTLYVMLDIEFPRYGLVNLAQVNQTLVDLARTMR
jgi:hypothetical protein